MARQAFDFAAWDKVVNDLITKRDTFRSGPSYRRLQALLEALRDEWDMEKN